MAKVHRGISKDQKSGMMPDDRNRGVTNMRVSIRLLGAVVAVIALLGGGLRSANADSGGVSLTVYKAGWFIGGSGGSGTLIFHGRRYRLGVGGIDVGLVFGGSKTVLRGRVS